MPILFINLNTQNVKPGVAGEEVSEWEWDKTKESHRFHPPAAAGRAEGVHPIPLLWACARIPVQMRIRMDLSCWNVNVQTQPQQLPAQGKALPLLVSVPQKPCR